MHTCKVIINIIMINLGFFVFGGGFLVKKKKIVKELFSNQNAGRIHKAGQLAQGQEAPVATCAQALTAWKEC